MKGSTIKSEEGYLVGEHEHAHKLRVRDEQHMIFWPCDEEPYWMSPNEQEKTRKAQYGITII
jgi:hypothetical protein